MTDKLANASENETEDGQTLAELLEAYLGGEGTFNTDIHRGDVVDGTVVSVAKDGLLVDVGMKSEGIVSTQDLNHLDPEFVEALEVGSEILVYVVNPENNDGQAILSLSRARAEQGWRVLQKLMDAGDTIEAEVVDYNKGGLIAITEGVRGFVPASQIVSLRSIDDVDPSEANPALAAMIGAKLQLKVLEVNRRRNRLVLSERAAMQEVRSLMRDKLIEELKEGEIRRGRVTSIRNFGAFVDLGGADGLVHLSELSWNRIDDPNEVVKVGIEVDVYVMNVDPETKRIALSLRRAQPEPWDEVAEKFVVGQLVMGTVTKLVNFGAFARLQGPVEGLIHVSELTDRHIVHPKEVVGEGDSLLLKIVRIEPERHRLALSLKQAQEEIGEEYEQRLAEARAEAGIPAVSPKPEDSTTEESDAVDDSSETPSKDEKSADVLPAEESEPEGSDSSEEGPVGDEEAAVEKDEESGDGEVVSA